MPKKSNFKHLFLLVKRITQFTNKNKEESAQLLLNVFSKYNVFKLPENKQLIIIKNLLSYFDLIVSGIETFKKKNHLISEKDIIEHIENKTFDLVINSEKLIIY